MAITSQTTAAAWEVLQENARQISFTGSMIQKIRARQKTETRRVVKDLRPGRPYRVAGPHMVNGLPTAIWSAFAGEEHVPLVCRYGMIGGRLWVKEDFATRLDAAQKTVRIRYKADGSHGPVHVVPAETVPARYWTSSYVSRKSRHMPKWASRLILAVVGLKLEPLQAITWQSVLAEGIELPGHGERLWNSQSEACQAELLAEFRSVWDLINAARGYAFAVDPLVWAIRFALVQDATAGEEDSRGDAETRSEEGESRKHESTKGNR